MRQMCHLAVALQNEARIRAAVFKELVVRIENDERDLALAQNAQLHGLLEQTILPLVERDVTISVVFDGFDRNLSPAHLLITMFGKGSRAWEMEVSEKL